MKRILSLIVMVIFVSGCSNNEDVNKDNSNEKEQEIITEKTEKNNDKKQNGLPLIIEEELNEEAIDASKKFYFDNAYNAYEGLRFAVSDKRDGKVYVQSCIPSEATSSCSIDNEYEYDPSTGEVKALRGFYYDEELNNFNKSQIEYAVKKIEEYYDDEYGLYPEIKFYPESAKDNSIYVKVYEHIEGPKIGPTLGLYSIDVITGQINGSLLNPYPPSNFYYIEHLHSRWTHE
mgnify:CR=1 FL=1